MRSSIPGLFLLLALPLINGYKVVLGNDDGWAEAAVRAQFSALDNAGFEVLLSCPAFDKSGTGPLTIIPVPVLLPCEYNSCPAGSPAIGFNKSDPRLNYVNAFPLDAMNYGIDELKLLGGAPDLAVAGPNVGNNVGLLLVSGTVNAARVAALAGVPSIAFSGSQSDSLSHVSYTTLKSAPNSANTVASNLYAQLSLKLINALLHSPGPFLPAGISLNVNYPSISGCPKVSNYKFVLTRVLPNPLVEDVETCGTNHLPVESNVVGKSGCFVSVSVFHAQSYSDVNSATQKIVLDRLGSFLSCVS
ncbi:hypothetical protein D9757_003261 [Collybiopsis confluens]|uniref:Survival protein SurE-like phosphatase/nucleotidase domain-containing protein n=1 Tax=Collybiopsis confluens TaxID=2823264 RepID=A0A8H5HYR8_9AGAR|nr:hypothetical protein D9757_003261 [Collybiopsis confluens]